MLRFDGQTAIVTGAGGGLGRQYALLLAERGASVVVNDVGGSVAGDGHTPGTADNVVAEIRAAGGRAVASADSVATEQGGAAIVQTALSEFGSVEIVINNAGILRDKAFHNMSRELIEPVLDVHLKGAFFVTQPAWCYMRSNSYGRIVNTSSNSGIIGNFGQSNYGAAKAGIVGLTRVLAAEGERFNINVNAIAPAARTRMTESVLDGEVGATLGPEAVAPVVGWLAHRDCKTTGEVFSAGGGRVARFFTGLTPGYFAPSLSPERVAANWEQIRSPEGYTIPKSPSEEIEQLMASWAAYRQDGK